MFGGERGFADPAFMTRYLDSQPASLRPASVLLRHYVQAARSEPGNQSVAAYRELSRPGRFVVMEVWEDAAALANHEKSAATLSFRDGFKAIERSPADPRVTHGFVVDPMPAPAGSHAFVVVTHVDVPGPRREEAESIMREMIGPAQQTAGHVRYDVLQQNDPRMNHFTLFAIWKSRREFDSYGTTVHWRRYREQLAPLLGALYDERLYDPL
jgi:quinol monooxygenase YgiN